MKSSPGVTKTDSGVAAIGGGSSLRRNVMIAASVVVIVLIVAGAAMLSQGSQGVPRLNAETVALAKFASTEEYTKLPFDKQQLYMKVLEDREDNGELKRAYTANQLTESEYRTAQQEAWLGEQLKKSEKFASFPAGPVRMMYVSELLDKKDRKKAQESKIKKDTDNEVKRDDTLEKMRIASWPADVRVQWEEFRRAYEDQKDARDKAAEANQKAKEASQEAQPAQ